MLQKDDKALFFILPGYGLGRKTTISLEKMSCKYLVLFFYPKDNTPGCIQEASAFSLLNQQFARNNVNVIGISKDSVESHKKFVDNYGLNIYLASDEGLDVCKYYGVWQSKKVFKNEYFGIVRSTFVIDMKTKKIINSWKVSKVKGHAQEVLNWIDRNVVKKD